MDNYRVKYTFYLYKLHSNHWAGSASLTGTELEVANPVLVKTTTNQSCCCIDTIWMLSPMKIAIKVLWRTD